MRLIVIRLLPVALLIAAAGFWFNEVQAAGPWFVRNLAPPAIVLLLAAITLWRGDGHWVGSGWRLPLGTAGFAIPALGLSLYLHYAFSVNLNDMFPGTTDSGQLFRFLPFYTIGAGVIGFAIGWIIGRNL